MAPAKTLLIWLMLALMPLMGVRIICVTEMPTSAAGAPSDDALDCQTMCSRHAPHVKTRCVLVEDPSCAFALASPIAVMPEAPVLSYRPTTEPFAVTNAARRPATSLDRSSPPPKP
ncbi:MAG TPA: hypothetical protein VNR64_11125 [Vicinamibacterales bacterium]|nr:hypothetical protein [Vicinamibacterales bacterium]